MNRRPLISVLGGLALLLAPVQLPADASNAAATLTVKTRDNPSQPQLLSTSFGRITDVDLDSVGGTATGVTVTFSGAGLAIDTPVVEVGDLNSADRVSVEVTAVTGGFHTLEVEVTSDNSSTVNATLPLMWSPGGTPIEATGSLAGQSFGNIDLYTEFGSSHADRQLLTFLDQETAFIGLPPKGRPICTKASATKREGCVTYSYHQATGLVRIGGAIGRVAGNGSIYTNGIGRSDDQADEAFNERTFTDRIGYPSAGKRYARTWVWTSDEFLGGLSAVRLTLRKNGSFELRSSIDNKLSKVRKGSYKLTAPGRLVLKGKFGTETHTFAVRLDGAKKPDPNKGVWLTFGKGNGVYGALLKPKH